MSKRGCETRIPVATDAAAPRTAAGTAAAETADARERRAAIWGKCMASVKSVILSREK